MASISPWITNDKFEPTADAAPTADAYSQQAAHTGWQPVKPFTSHPSQSQYSTSSRLYCRLTPVHTAATGSQPTPLLAEATSFVASSAGSSIAPPGPSSHGETYQCDSGLDLAAGAEVVVINGREVTIQPGQTILQAATLAGVRVRSHEFRKPHRAPFGTMSRLHYHSAAANDADSRSQDQAARPRAPPPEPDADVVVTINGRAVVIKPGQNIMDAAKQAGIRNIHQHPDQLPERSRFSTSSVAMCRAAPITAAKPPSTLATPASCATLASAMVATGHRPAAGAAAVLDAVQEPETVPQEPAASITINGRHVSFQPGQTILEAATAAGIYIPALCYHPRLPSAPGTCR